MLLDCFMLVLLMRNMVPDDSSSKIPAFNSYKDLGIGIIEDSEYLDRQELENLALSGHSFEDEFLRNQKKVLWVHLEKDAKPIHILMVEGQVFEIVGADHEFVSESDADTVVIDGVVGGVYRHSLYMESLWEWRVNPNRKAIIYASENQQCE